MKKIYLMLLATMPVFAGYGQSGINLISFSSGYVSPLGIENCGDNRLFIIQKGGQIFICDTVGTKSPTPYLDISDRITSASSEQGLLGLLSIPITGRMAFFMLTI